MDLNKYSDLREKIEGQDFETKNKGVDKSLNIFSYFGNLGSIFFAFFLVNPALHKAISANLIQSDVSKVLALIITILILSGFELIKRKVLSNLSFDIIMNKFKINKSLIGWLVFSIGFIVASFYFSLNGAKNFASTSKEKNNIVLNTYEAEIDSISEYYQLSKLQYIEDNESLRKSNKQNRDKISETPLNYIKVRNGLQEIIDANLVAIEKNDVKISQLDSELQAKIKAIEDKSKTEQQKNESEDTDNVLLFLIISSSIEIIIIIGVYFRKYYEYNVYKSQAAKLEELYKKRDRYKTLIKFIYKEGMVGANQKIIGKSKMIELVKEKSSLPMPAKFIDGFINDMEYLGIIKLNGTRRYTATTYQDAIEKIYKFDDTLRLLENLD